MKANELSRGPAAPSVGGLQNVDQIARLPAGLAAIAIQNDQLMGMAVSRPRDFGEIRARLEEELKIFPAQAENLIYAKPVGKLPDVCLDCGEEMFPRKDKKLWSSCIKCKSKRIQPGGQKIARGLSVRAAESLAEVYGFNRITTEIEPQGSDINSAKVKATFTDLQACRVWEATTVVSRQYTDRNGGTQWTPIDRFLGVTAQASASKCVREVVVRSLNASLKAWFFDLVDKTIAGTLTDDRVKKLVASFHSKGVELKHLESILGHPLAMGISIEERKTLAGIWNTLESGEMSVRELLADIAGGTEVGEDETVRSGTLNALTGEDGNAATQAVSGEETQVEGNTEPQQSDAPAATGEAAAAKTEESSATSGSRSALAAAQEKALREKRRSKPQKELSDDPLDEAPEN